MLVRSCVRCVGSWAGAQQEVAQAPPVSRRKPSSAIAKPCRRNQSTAWSRPGKSGNWPGSVTKYTALLPVPERVSGAEHPETCAARILDREVDLPLSAACRVL